jgi:hypothetical protein
MDLQNVRRQYLGPEQGSAVRVRTVAIVREPLISSKWKIRAFRATSGKRVPKSIARAIVVDHKRSLMRPWTTVGGMIGGMHCLCIQLRYSFERLVSLSFGSTPTLDRRA